MIPELRSLSLREEMAKKSSNRSTKKKKSRKIVSKWREELESLGYGRILTVDDSYLDRLGDDFIKWTREGSEHIEKRRRRLSLERFLEERGIIYKTLQRWRKRNKRFDEKISHGLMIIGNMLEEGMLYKEYSEKGTLYIMSHYLERYEKIDGYQDERRRSVQPDTSGSGGSFNIHLDGVPESSLVPVKGK